MGQDEYYNEEGGYKPPKGTYDATFGDENGGTEPSPSSEATQKQTATTDTEQPGTTVSTDTEQPTPSASTDYSGDLIGYDKQIGLLEDARKQYESANETPEQKAKREKREKSKRIVAAVGDGLRALSNLYFTSQYAPNMYNHEKESQLKQTDARIDKMKAEREANREKYLNYSLKIGDLQNGKAKTLRELQAQAEKMKLAREAAAREAEAHGWKQALQPDLQRKATADADAAESKATTAGEEAKNAAALQAAKVETEKARGRAADASAANSKASAAAHGRTNAPEFYAYNEDGKEFKFRTKAAADAFAKQHGTFKEVPVNKSSKTTKTDPTTGEEATSTTNTTTSGGYAEKPVIDNTPPSRRGGNNDNTPPSRRK